MIFQYQRSRSLGQSLSSLQEKKHNLLSGGNWVLFHEALPSVVLDIEKFQRCTLSRFWQKWSTQVVDDYPRSTNAHSSYETPGCERHVGVDRKEMDGAGSAEQDSRWGATGSLLISHNPTLCFGPTRKLSLEQIHTSPTGDTFPPSSRVSPSRLSSLIPLSRDPHRGPVRSTVFLFPFLSPLCLFSKIKGPLSGAVNVWVCVWLYLFMPVEP